MTELTDEVTAKLIAERNRVLDAERRKAVEDAAAGQNTLSAVDQCAGQASKSVKVALSGAAAETLRCLFFHGPTWDGNVPSKSGRDDLVSMGLAARGNGWQWLTRAGIDACFANGIHDEKDRREAQERKRRLQVEQAARVVLGESLSSEGRTLL